MTEADWLAGADPGPLLHFAADRLSDRQRLHFMTGCLRRVWDLLTDHRFRRVAEAAEAVADGRAPETELIAAAPAVPPPGFLVNAGVGMPMRYAGPLRTHTLGVVNFRELPAWCRHAYHAVEAVVPRGVHRVADECAQATAGFARDRAAEDHPLNEEIGRVRAEVDRLHARAADLFRRGAGRLHGEAVAAATEAGREADVRVVDVAGRIAADASRAWSEMREAERAAQAGLVRCVAGNLPRPVVADPDWRTAAVVALAGTITADRMWDRLPVLADALEDAGCTDPAVLAHCRNDPAHAPGCWVVELLRPAVPV